MSEITTVGIDLAKQVFSIHSVDAAGHVVMRRTVRRAQLAELIANIAPCVIGMEACSGAHEWGRRFERLGHRVRLMAPKFIIPYRKSGKNDGNDAEAICEAVQRPNMRFVPLKSVEQQSVLVLHRVRQGFVEERTATINRIRGLLSEFGQVLPQRSVHIRRELSVYLDALPLPVKIALGELREHIRLLDERIADYEHRITDHARHDARAQRALALRGIGPIAASAAVATVGSAREFKNGRQFAAWIGLVPRQYSTGGKIRLGHITARGDAYLRTLLIMGARATLQMAARHNDRRSRWALSVKQRRGYHRACVAIANKNARILWALLSHDQPLRTETIAV
ncbi:MAG TPA: IS110 family transposase [Steroidobacteraceae bacterium]|nr:IS110 family transposase [Steroidobacteraceae bacterium]